MVIKKNNEFDYALGIAILSLGGGSHSLKEFFSRFQANYGYDDSVLEFFEVFSSDKSLSYHSVMAIKEWVKKSRMRDTVILPEGAREFVESFYKEWNEFVSSTQ